MRYVTVETIHKSFPCHGKRGPGGSSHHIHHTSSFHHTLCIWHHTFPQHKWHTTGLTYATLEYTEWTWKSAPLMTPSFHSNCPPSFPSYFPGSGTIQELPGISAELIEVHLLYEDKNLTFSFKHFGNFKTCKWMERCELTLIFMSGWFHY